MAGQCFISAFGAPFSGQINLGGVAASFEFDFIQLLALKAIAHAFVALFTDQDPIRFAQSLNPCCFVHGIADMVANANAFSEPKLPTLQ